jgi:molybdate transport system substrate-binding protein
MTEFKSEPGVDIMFTRRRFGLALAISGLAAVFFAAAPAAQAADNVTVFAAASLKNALDNINTAWQADAGKQATISYASSSALAKQIEEGAPADVFISADLDWMKYLSDKKLIKADTELKLLGNRIVLVAPKDATTEATIAPNFDLAALLGDGKLAMGDVKAVPAGKYGKAALEKLGVWASVEGKVAQAENVRAALKLVSTGEAALGIVYATDAVAEPDVKVVGTFPEDSHAPIVYPVGLTAESKNADADGFVKYLQSAKAKEMFEAQGFTFLAPVASN